MVICSVIPKLKDGDESKELNEVIQVINTFIDSCSGKKIQLVK